MRKDIPPVVYARAVFSLFCVGKRTLPTGKQDSRGMVYIIMQIYIRNGGN